MIGVLVDPGPVHYTRSRLRGLHAAGRTLGLQLHVLACEHRRGDFDTVFANVAQLRAGALVIGASVFFNSRSEQLAALAVRHAVPAIYQLREFAAAGGLMTYGGSLPDRSRPSRRLYRSHPQGREAFRSAGCSSPPKFELIINLKTAKALGLKVPTSMLLRADEVIE